MSDGIVQPPSLSANRPPSAAELKKLEASLRSVVTAVQKGSYSPEKVATAAAGIVEERSAAGIEAPTAPTEFTVTGAFATIFLQWGAPTYLGHFYTEIYRSQTNDLGTAVKVGDSTALVWADTPPNQSLSATYYYWIRHVNRSGVEGPFNAQGGTAGSTADDPAYVKEILAGEVTSSLLHSTLNARIDLVDTPTTGLVDKVNTLQGQVNSLAGEIAGAVYVQPAAPAPGVNGIPDPIPDNARWYDSDDNNHPYIWHNPGTGYVWLDLADPRVGQNSADIDALELTVNDPVTGVAATSSGLDALENTVTTLNGTVTSQGNRLTTLESTVENPSTGVSATASGLSTLTTRVTATENTNSSQASQITTLSTTQATLTKTFQSVMDEDLSQWEKYTGSGELSLVATSEAQSGSKVLRIGNNTGDDSARVVHKALLPFDPNAIYRTTVRARMTAGTTGKFYAGFAGVAADGVTLVNVSGTNTAATQHYHAAFDKVLPTGWTEYTGYTKGFAATGLNGEAVNLSSPGQVHQSVRYLRPMISANYSAAAGITEIDLFKVEIVTAELQSNTASVQTLTTTTNGLSAQYVIKIDNNGFPSGIGLASDPVDGIPFSILQVLADRFAIVNPNTAPIAVSSITRSSTTATVTTASAHGRTSGDWVVITGASPYGYNGAKQITVTSTTTFTFTCPSSLATPAATASGFAGIKVGHASVPFIVQNGKVYLDIVMIVDASITGAKIAQATIDDGHINNLNVAKLLAGVITAGGIWLGASQKFHLDGANQRIQIKNDAGQTVINLGKLGTGWGTEMFDASGNLIFSTNSGGIPRTWAVPGNMLVNALPHAAVAGSNTVPADWGTWRTAEHNGGYSAGVNLGSDWTIPGEFTPYIVQPNGTSTGYQYFYFTKNGQRYPIAAGKRYETSVYTGAHRCRAYVGLEFYDENGNFLSSANSLGVSENNNEQSGWKVLANYKRIGAFFTAPAGAAYAIPNVFKSATFAGNSDSYLFVTRAYFGEAGAEQTELSPWSPGMHAGGPIAPGNVSTFIEAAAVETLMANRVYVNTLNIGANAVTVPVSAFASASMALSGTWWSVISAAINAEGQPIHLTFTCNGTIQSTSGESSYGAGIFARVLRDGIEIWPAAQVLYNWGMYGPYIDGTIAISLKDLPGWGAHVYDVQMYKSSALALASVSGRSINLLGVKR